MQRDLTRYDQEMSDCHTRARKMNTRVSLLLLSGAVANVAVAWTPVLVQQRASAPFNSSYDREMEVEPGRQAEIQRRGIKPMDSSERARLVAVGWKPSGSPPVDVDPSRRVESSIAPRCNLFVR